MNRANAPQSGLNALQPGSGFETSVSAVDRKPIADFTLPSQAALFNADSTAPQQLERLYPVSCIHSYLYEKLRPLAIDPSLLAPLRFQAELSASKDLLSHLALHRYADARRFGRVVRLLDEQDALCRLAQMYASALLQG